MRIAVFYELDPGGARRGANEFARAIKLQGHTVDLFFIDEKDTFQEKKYYSHVFFYKFIPKVWNGGNFKVKLYKDFIEIYKLYRLHKKIAKDIEKNSYDFAFIHGSKFTQAPFILSCLSITKIYYCQEPLRMIYETIFSAPKNLDPIRKTYEKLTRNIKKIIDIFNIKNADIILTNSTFTKNNIYNAYKLNSTVCHMGVDTSNFYPTLKKEIDILFIGTKDIFEGYELFEESIKNLKKKVKIFYLMRGENWVSNDKQLRDYYSKSRIVICFGFNEPFGLIPLEALSCGAIVIALDEGGYKDSIKNNKTGFLVPKDPIVVSKIFEKILSNKNLQNKISQNAILDMKKNWTWKRGADQIIKTFKEAKK